MIVQFYKFLLKLIRANLFAFINELLFSPNVLSSIKSFLSHTTTFPKINGLLNWDCNVIRVFHNKHNLNSCTTMRNQLSRRDRTRARAHSLVTWLCPTTITRRIVSPSSPLVTLCTHCTSCLGVPAPPRHGRPTLQAALISLRKTGRIPSYLIISLSDRSLARTCFV